MKTAYFVESLNIKKVQLLDTGGEQVVCYHTMNMGSRVTGSNDLLLTEERCQSKIVRAREFCKLEGTSDLIFKELIDPPHWENTYIAISEEVSEYLQLPFELMDEKIKDLEMLNVGLKKEVRSYKDKITEMEYRVSRAGLWGRIKYLFMGGYDLFYEK